MSRLLITALAVAALAAPAQAEEVTGQYVEVRTCDVWTGPCFANAEGNLTGKNAVMAWRIEKGTLNGVNLDGLSVVAVVEASDTIGAKQYGQSQAIVYVDGAATKAQRDALVELAQLQGGELLANVAEVRTTTINVNVLECHGDGCAEVVAEGVRIKTRCLDEHQDKACGNETAYYPPLAAGVNCTVAVAEHSYQGHGLSSAWQETERRGAYVGTFSIR